MCVFEGGRQDLGVIVVGRGRWIGIGCETECERWTR